MLPFFIVLNTSILSYLSILFISRGWESGILVLPSLLLLVFFFEAVFWSTTKYMSQQKRRVYLYVHILITIVSIVFFPTEMKQALFGLFGFDIVLHITIGLSVIVAVVMRKLADFGFKLLLFPIVLPAIIAVVMRIFFL